MSQIGFAHIPENLRIPLFWVEFDNSMAGQNQTQTRSLLIGQALTAQPAALTYISTAEDAASLFGRGSMLARMVAAFRANNTFGELYCLPLADAGAGAAATGTLAITGPATAAGTLPLYIAGQSVPVAVSAGDIAATVATNVAAAINAAVDLPVTASAASATVTLTARHKGALGNAISLVLAFLGAKGNESVPAGLAVAITAMHSGATDPDLTSTGTDIAAIAADEPFDYIAIPYTGTAQLNAVQAMMNDSTGRWAWSSQIWGHVFSARVSSGSTLSAQVADALGFGNARNDPHVTVVCYEAASPTPPWEVAGAWTAQAAQAIDADPARPLQTLPLVGVLAPPVGTRFRRPDQQSLLTSGCALASYDRAGNAAILRSVTTYATNSFGQPDQSYLDCEILFALMAVTRRLAAAITQKFPRSKLAQDGTPFGAGQPIVTPKSIRAELIAEYASMCADALCQAPKAFATALIVEIASDDPSRVNVLFPPYLVSGLRIFALRNQFRLIAPSQ